MAFKRFCLAGCLFLALHLPTAAAVPKKGRIVVGGALQLSGRFANYGWQAKRIADTWKTYVDSNPDFPFTIDLRLEDDGSSSARAESLDKAMLQPRGRDSPDVLICPYTSTASIKVCNMLDDENITVLCGVWGGASGKIFAYPERGLGNNLRVQSFSLAAGYMVSALELAHAKLTGTGLTQAPTIAFVYLESDAFGKGACMGAHRRAHELGYDIKFMAAPDNLTDADGGATIYQQLKNTFGRIPFIDLYDVTLRAMGPLIEQAAMVDVMVSCGLYDAQTSVLLGLITRRLKPMFLLMTNAADPKLMRSALPFNVIDIFQPVQWAPSMSGEDEIFGTSQAFFDNYNSNWSSAAFGSKLSYHGASFGGFMTMLYRALNHSADSANCTDDGECELNATALRAAFRAPSVNKATFYGIIDINEYGANTKKPMLAEQLQLGSGGSIVAVPAAPENLIPASWKAKHSNFPTWPATPWEATRALFINSYCGTAGYELNDFEVVQISDHLPSAQYGTFKPPPPGSVRPCRPCSRGTSRPARWGQCFDCAAGMFASNEGQSQCDLCPVGRSTEFEGQHECLNCSIGKVAPELGRKTCLACSPGKYADLQGMSECKACEVGRYQPNLDSRECLPCDMRGEKTTRHLGTRSHNDCICHEGTYAGVQLLENSCLPCPKGMACMAGVGPPQLLPGFWAVDSDDLDRTYSVYVCRTVLECPGGPAGTCADGRTGIGCGNCVWGKRPDRQSGKCMDCSGPDVIPMIFCSLAFVAVLLGLAFGANRDITKLPLNTVVMMVILGQMLVAIQWLSVFNSVQVVWVEPFSSLWSLFGVLSFRFEVLRISCFIPEKEAVLLFALKLMVLPVGACILFLSMRMLQFFAKRPFVVNHYINAMGLIVVIMYLTLTLTALSPFFCIDSPNGLKSIQSSPSLVCGSSGTYIGLATLGVGGILLYAVLPFAFISHATWVYPHLVVAGRSHIINARYRFLFQRFEASRYYFAPVYLLRNAAIALTHAVLANHPHLEVLILCTIVILAMLATSWLQPWRGKMPNILDAGFMVVYTLVIVTAAILVEGDRNRINEDMQVFLTCALPLPALAFIGALFFFVAKRLYRKKTKKFRCFLSHHKVGMAGGARLLKMELEPRLRGNIFLDSDALDNLDGLLETVSHDVDFLVLLLTDQTLWRPWCAGEIAMAMSNDVPIICVACDEYSDPQPADLTPHALEQRFPPADFAPISLQGVTWEQLSIAYNVVRDSPKLSWSRVQNELAMGKGDEALTELVGMIVEECSQTALKGRQERRLSSGGSNESTKYRRSSFSLTGRPLQQSLTQVEVAVLANGEDGEAISAAKVLARLISMQTQMVAGPVFVKDSIKCENQPKWMVVLLSNAAFASQSFSSCVIEAHASWNSSGLVTVSTPTFDFPARSSLDRTLFPAMASSAQVPLQDVQSAMSRILSSLALPLNHFGSFAAMMAEVQAINRRFRSTVTSSDMNSGQLNGNTVPAADQDVAPANVQVPNIMDIIDPLDDGLIEI